jgi:hypothetical protein
MIVFYSERIEEVGGYSTTHVSTMSGTSSIKVPIRITAANNNETFATPA